MRMQLGHWWSGCHDLNVREVLRRDKGKVRSGVARSRGWVGECYEDSEFAVDIQILNVFPKLRWALSVNSTKAGLAHDYARLEPDCAKINF
jgi:hypothetical protein